MDVNPKLLLTDYCCHHFQNSRDHLDILKLNNSQRQSRLSTLSLDTKYGKPIVRTAMKALN